MKSLWKLPQPWTPRTRPPLLGNHRTVSTSSHRQSRVLVQKGTFLFRDERGHFYFALTDAIRTFDIFRTRVYTRPGIP